MTQEDNDILDIAEIFQKDAHDTIEAMIELNAKPKFQYQDANSVWVFRKLAEFEYRLRKLETSK